MFAIERWRVLYEEQITRAAGEEKERFKQELKDKLVLVDERLVTSGLRERRKRLETSRTDCLDDVDVELVTDRLIKSSEEWPMRYRVWMVGGVSLLVGLGEVGAAIGRADPTTQPAPPAMPDTTPPGKPHFDSTGARVGEQLPDLPLYTLEGKPAFLEESWGGPATLRRLEITGRRAQHGRARR